MLLLIKEEGLLTALDENLTTTIIERTGRYSVPNIRVTRGGTATLVPYSQRALESTNNEDRLLLWQKGFIEMGTISYLDRIRKKINTDREEKNKKYNKPGGKFKYLPPIYADIYELEIGIQKIIEKKLHTKKQMEKFLHNIEKNGFATAFRRKFGRPERIVNKFILED